MIPIELQNLDVIFLALIQQGFEIRLVLSVDAHTCVTIAGVRKNGEYVAHFLVTSQDYDLRARALQRCREAGFHWPD